MVGCLAIFVICICTFSTTTSEEVGKETSDTIIWSWKCEEKGCQKTKNTGNPMSLSVCQLTCPPGKLWPKPNGLSNISSNVTPVNHNSIYIKTNILVKSEKNAEKVNDFVQSAGKIFKEDVHRLHAKVQSTGKNLVITLVLSDDIVQYVQGVKEGYRIISQPNTEGINVTIIADNVIGARHGLETLSQLLVYDDVTSAIVMPLTIDIKDEPLYSYRGILVDTSRNYVPVKNIKRTLDAMRMNKLNSFHWHLTDTHSFPFESKSFPLLSKYGAYSKEKVYTETDIKEIVQYGRVRGIRIVPEFDAPAHVGEGWQWVEGAVVCFNAAPWEKFCAEPPCGQFDPTSENVYKILAGIYKDMTSLFESDLFHMGGDEVNTNCWNATESIVANMKEMGLGRKSEDFHDLWAKFQSRALDLLDKSTNQKLKPILWTSSLTDAKHVDKYLDSSKYIIQVWTEGNDPVISELLNKGFSIIMSNYDALYLDCGFGAWTSMGPSWCGSYKQWHKVYQNDPMKLLNVTSSDQILGSEVTIWTETSDGNSIDTLLWPRASALAEQLWSGSENWEHALKRLVIQRERMSKNKIRAEALQPEWCYQNEGHCY